MQHQRPDGVTLISVYHFIVAGLLLLGACALISVPFIVGFATQGEPDARVALPIVSIIVAVGIGFLFLIAVANAAVGWGLWRLQPWARMGAVALSILALFNVPVGTILGGFILWYLFQPEARLAFGEQVAVSEDVE